MAMQGLLSVILMTGLVRCEISSCYKVDMSWANSTVLETETNVPDYEECQILCKDTYGCVGWTWTDEENQDIAANCLMFSHLGELTQYQNCVRQESIPLNGPPSCLCSAAKKRNGSVRADLIWLSRVVRSKAMELVSVAVTCLLPSESNRTT